MKLNVREFNKIPGINLLGGGPPLTTEEIQEMVQISQQELSDIDDEQETEEIETVQVEDTESDFSFGSPITATATV